MERNIKVMGIINVTDDSYFPESRCHSPQEAVGRAAKLTEEGADILDIGGCSTRPGSESADARTEWERLKPAIIAIRKEFPGMPLSIDTFRAEIVAMAYEQIGGFLVNDISAGAADPKMLDTVGSLGLGYVAMHMRGTPADMAGRCDYAGDVTGEVIRFFKDFLPRAEAAGIRECIIDPGFGFAKTVGQNYVLLHETDRLKSALGKKILVGVSRKSMIYKLLGITPEEALPATQAVHLEAMIRGADILRVHDVAQAVQCRTIYEQLYCNRQSSQERIS